MNPSIFNNAYNNVYGSVVDQEAKKKQIAAAIFEKIYSEHPDAFSADQLSKITGGIQSSGRLELPTTRTVPAYGPSMPGQPGPTAQAPIDLTARDPLAVFNQGTGKFDPAPSWIKSKDQIVKEVPPKQPAPSHTLSFDERKKLKEQETDAETNRSTLQQFLTALRSGNSVPPELKEMGIKAGEALGRDMSMFKMKAKPSNGFIDKLLGLIGLQRSGQSGETKRTEKKVNPTTENPYKTAYPDAFFEDGKWKVIQDGKKFVITE